MLAHSIVRLPERAISLFNRSCCHTNSVIIVWLHRTGLWLLFIRVAINLHDYQHPDNGIKELILSHDIQHVVINAQQVTLNGEYTTPTASNALWAFFGFSHRARGLLTFPLQMTTVARYTSPGRDQQIGYLDNSTIIFK